MTEQRGAGRPVQDTAASPATTDDGVWRLAAALSAAQTPNDVAVALAEEGAPVAGASFSNMAVLDDRTKRVHAVHHSTLDRALAAKWGEFDLTEPTPLSDAMVSGVPVLIGSASDMLAKYPEVSTATLAASITAAACFPLPAADGEILGAAGFGWPVAQSFGAEQVRGLDRIVNLAAQALERAVVNQRNHEEALLQERSDAQLIQSAFLPRVLPHTDTLDVAAVYLPASDAAMGGDWYDVFPVDGGNCLVIGDVTGHGVQSAAVMAELRNTVRAYAIEDPSPARVLTRLNNMMCRLEPGAHASAIVAVWDAANGTLLRSNAGHPPVLRCRQGEFGFLERPDGVLLLGVAPGWVYEEEIKILRPGTTLLFYTDGLFEWREPHIGDGMEVLLSFVAGLSDLSPQAVCDQVIAWRLEQARQEDDVCVLAARLR